MASAHEEHHALGHLHRLSGQAGLIITLALWSVAFLCGAVTYSALVKETFQALISGSSLVWKFTIVIYFTSWIAGVKIDKDNERDIYKTAPREGRIDPLSTTLAMAVFVLFGLMYLIEDLATGSSDAFLAIGLRHVVNPGAYQGLAHLLDGYGRLVLVLLIHALWLFNIPLWRYFIRHFIAPMTEASLRLCAKRHDYAGTKRIQIMSSYLMGDWQKLRFGVGIAYLAVVDVAYFAVLMHIPNGAVYLSILICGFVLAMEAWVWLMRFKVRFALGCVDEIVADYKLTKKPARAVAAPPGGE
jgi:hypothetical protein